MKTKIKILFLLTSLLCVTNVWAADTLYVNNTAALNKEQKDVLEYSRALLSAKGDKIALPIEVYSIVGITDNNNSPQAELLWDKAHFKKENDWKCTLAIPLQAKTPIGVMNSTLYVRSNVNGVYHRIVVTSLPTAEYVKSNKKANSDDSKYSGYAINSNIDGVFVRAFYYDNGKAKYQVEGVKGNNGIIDSKRGSRYEYNKGNKKR